MAAQEMLAYTASLRLRVQRSDDAFAQIERTVRQFGGRLVGRNDRSVTVLVPVDQRDSAMRAIATAGVELGRGVEVQNLTERWLDASAKLRSVRQSYERLVGMGRLARDGVKAPILLHQEIGASENAAVSLQAELLGIGEKVSSATITVAIEPVEAIESEPVPRFQLPFPWLDRIGLDRLMNLGRIDEPLAPSELRYKLVTEGEVGFGLSLMELAEPDKLGGTKMTIAGRMHARGVVDADPIGAAVGLDLGFGTGLDGGFGYELRGLAGPGFTLGKHVSIGALTGVGGSGLSGGHMPSALDIPVELFIASDVTRYAQLRIWGRNSWLIGSDARKSGSSHALFGDELWSGATMILGTDHGDESRERTGLLLGVTYAELLGTKALGLTIGYAGGFGDRRMR